jgi:hypothetical protein
MLMQRARLTPDSTVRYHCRKFRLALFINLKTGKALGITGPAALLCTDYWAILSNQYTLCFL